MLASALSNAPLAAKSTSRQADTAIAADAANVIAMLLEALTCPDRYEIIEHDGELFVRPIEARKDVSTRLAA